MPEQQLSQPTFTGGQCQGVIYTVSYYYVSEYGYTSEHNTVDLLGPIRGIEKTVTARPDGTRQLSIAIVCQGRPNQPQEDYRWGFLGIGGRVTDEEVAKTNGFIVSVQRADGLADTCGDPPIAEPPNANPYNPEPDNNCCTADAPFNSEVELHSGAVIETHDLVSYQSLGISRGLTLRYNSLQADPRPIVHFGYNSIYSQPGYDRLLLAKLSVRRGTFEYQVPGYSGNQYGLSGGEHFWSLPNDTSTNPPTSRRIDASLQVDLRSQPSGQYQYSLKRSIQPFNRTSPQFSSPSEVETGKLVMINRINSPFGSGWSLAGLQELIQNDDGSILLLDGSGRQLLFQAPTTAGTAYISPPGDFSKLEQLSNGTRRILKDQTVYTFNAQNKLAQVRDRNGNLTQYLYDAANQLTQIIDPVGLPTTFAYTTGKVSAITDPAGRITRLEYDITGNLVRIIDPDTAQHTWEYDADHHMTASIDPRGHRGQDFYDFAGRATRAVRKDGSTVEITPVEVKGLYRPEQTIDPFTAPTPFSPSDTEAGAPEAAYVDGNDNPVHTRLDASGHAISSFDAVGALPTVERNAQHLVSRTTDARGHVTTYSYDSRGNLQSSKDELVAPAHALTPPGYSLAFDGVDDYVRLKNAALVANVPNSTIEMWVKFDTLVTSSNHTLYSEDTASGSTFWLHQSNGYLKFAIYRSDVAGNWSGIETPINTTNQWVHVAAVLSATVGMRLYVNGNLMASSVNNRPANLTIASANLGRTANAGGSNYFEGQLDEVRVWNVARTQAQLQADMHQRLSGAEVGLLGYWRCDEGTGTTISDPNGNPGTLVGGTAWVRDAAPLGDSITGYPSFTYEPLFNQLTSTTDELGRQTRYQIDPANGNVLSITQVVGVLGGTDDVVTQYTYTSQGLVNTITDPLGRIADYDYDAWGRLITLTTAKGTSDQAIERYEYDAAGNRSATIDQNGNRTQLEYDASNRLVKVTEPDPDSAGPLTSPVTTYTYDPAGNLSKITDARGSITQYQYDPLNRRTKIIDANNGETVFSYDAAGNLVSVTDPLNHKTEFRYDQRNRRLETKDPQAGRTQFEYDLDNNLIAVIDPLGNQTKFIYDARNRLRHQNDPLGNWTVYDYDSVNNLVAQTDRNNRATLFQYDELNRLTTETWVGTAQVIQHAYDKASNLTSITDRSSRLSYTYDNQNRVKTVNNTGTPDTPPVVFSYTYDPVGNLRSVTNTINGQSGGTNNYTYDALNRPTQITQSGTGVTHKRINLAYNAVSQFTHLKRYADLAGTQLVAASDYTYDTANRWTNLTHTKGATTLANYTWVYDAANRITQFTSPDGSSNYTYDVIDQLTATNHSYQTNETYSYDANGNRINTGYRTGTNNRLLTDSTYNYEYDNEGNRTKRTEIATGQVIEYIWDHRDRLTRVVTKNTSGNTVKEVKYTYDAYDRRIAKVVDPDGTGSATASTERFVYDGDHIALVFNGSGTRTNRYLHGPQIDQILADENAQGQVLWPLTDDQDTVRDLVNSSGTVQNHLKYNSFGRVTSESNTAVDHRFGYTGRELDEETGLVYYRARYYDPIIGRFIIEDLIGFMGGDVNLYRYVGNDPTNFIDSFGLAPRYPHSPNHPDCISLKETINNIKKDIAETRGELHENPIPLPGKTPNDKAKYSLSQRGHQYKLSNLKRILAERETEYLWKCGGPPPGAPAAVPAPSPAPSSSPDSCSAPIAPTPPSFNWPELPKIKFPPILPVIRWILGNPASP